MIDEKANARVADFVHRKIREVVKDPETAETLCPRSAAEDKRLCVDFVPSSRTSASSIKPIDRITANGIRLGGAADEAVELDALVLAGSTPAGALSRSTCAASAAGPCGEVGAGHTSVSGLGPEPVHDRPGSPPVLSNAGHPSNSTSIS